MLSEFIYMGAPGRDRPGPRGRLRELTVAGWRRGPHIPSGPVLVSVTDFRVARVSDLLRVYVEGLRMSRAWPSMTGGVGMWLWSKPLQRRAGSVSVWREEADLRRFVRWPPHAEIMRRFRDVGTVQSRKWAEEDFDAGLLWRRAAYSLAGDDPALWRGGTER